MRFNYNQSEKLPPLSWLAEIKKGADTVNVYCGRNVACQETFFVAGVWNGPFREGAFDTASFACCSGGKLMTDSVRFSTPGHTQEMLYSVHVADAVCISNSFAFLLSFNNLELDPDYYKYEEDLGSGLLGLSRCHRTTPLKDGNRVTIHRYCHIDCRQNASLVEKRRDSGLHFTSYSDYLLQVREILMQIAQNAEDTSRKQAYGMISSISKGYDAPATCVLAKEIGCDSVITFGAPASYEEDRGDDLARSLGYRHIYVENASRYKTNRQMMEAESLSTGDVGSTIIFFGHEELLKDKLFFMGVRGDSMWERLNSNVNDEFDFSLGNTLSQSNITIESALQNNTVMIYIPLIGADRWSEINRIARSDEMKPYSVCDDYDRPIPRRIIESAGIPRGSFGVKKAGAGISYHFDTLSRVGNKMSPTSYASLLDFNARLKRNFWKKWSYTLSFYYHDFSAYLNYIMLKLHIGFRFKTNTDFHSSALSSLLIQWGVHEMKKRYKC